METEQGKEKRAIAREKYRPSRIKTLLIAEAPPDNLNRFFYFEDVKQQDSLFLEIMGVIFPILKKNYIASGRDRSLKTNLLRRFQAEGLWLIDLCEIPK